MSTMRQMLYLEHLLLIRDFCSSKTDNKAIPIYFSDPAGQFFPKSPKKKIFLGEHPTDPPKCFFHRSLLRNLVYASFPNCKRRKARRGLGTRLLANVVCPYCALASAVFWLRSCVHAATEYGVPKKTDSIECCVCHGTLIH